jgi:hypothetical protein
MKCIKGDNFIHGSFSNAADKHRAKSHKVTVVSVSGSTFQSVSRSKLQTHNKVDSRIAKIFFNNARPFDSPRSLLSREMFFFIFRTLLQQCVVSSICLPVFAVHNIMYHIIRCRLSMS